MTEQTIVPRPPVEFAVAYLDKDLGAPAMCYPDRVALRRAGGGQLDGYRLSLPNLPALDAFVAECHAAGVGVYLPGEMVRRADDGVECTLVLLLSGARRERINERLILNERVEG